jgi:hypothetical protein
MSIHPTQEIDIEPVLRRSKRKVLKNITKNNKRYKM